MEDALQKSETIFRQQSGEVQTENFQTSTEK